MTLNLRGAYAIWKNEVMRMFRTAFGSILSPVITTSLYLVVFGAAIGSRMELPGGVEYGSFIVPGLLMLTLLTESTSNASFGIYMPKFTGAIYELLSAPVGVVETLVGFVGAAAAKSLILAAVILGTAALIIDYEIAHPVLAFFYILLVAATFSLLGFIIGLWANSFEKLQIVPLLILMPLTFLGGTFYSIDILPEPWRSVSLINPVVYLVNGLRWTFLGQSDFPIAVSLGATVAFLLICVGIIAWIFKTGWRLRE
ncbi:ABC transporter permease [Aurantiacibacter sediminis]|uniref:Transport permease protein n=1 Tax=Aurantiacibacter sediminis TaxID=2793064 RepID=A0ABS0N3K6_9SPHN|nr:ABC transporter permease [Aurantiacibacter sediminis]MBH5322537.1 ABC transporter permease [Aurantiacibacter sediminis]